MVRSMQEALVTKLVLDFLSTAGFLFALGTHRSFLFRFRLPTNSSLAGIA